MLNKLTKLSLPLSQMIRPAGKMTLNWPSIVRTPVSPSFTLPTRYYYLDVK